jgi:hypothetical protein
MFPPRVFRHVLFRTSADGKGSDARAITTRLQDQSNNLRKHSEVPGQAAVLAQPLDGGEV